MVQLRDQIVALGIRTEDLSMILWTAILDAVVEVRKPRPRAVTLWVMSGSDYFREVPVEELDRIAHSDLSNENKGKMLWEKSKAVEVHCTNATDTTLVLDDDQSWEDLRQFLQDLKGE